MAVKRARQDKLIDAAASAIEYVVEGDGDFPIDMLRFDLCWPATERDAMVVGYRGKRTVMIRGLKVPTEGRWASFGWTVPEGYGAQ